MSTNDRIDPENGDEKSPFQVARLIEEATSDFNDEVLTPEEERLLLEAQSTVLRVENSLRRHLTHRCPYCNKPVSVPSESDTEDLVANIRRHVKMTKDSVHGGSQGAAPKGFDGRIEEIRENIQKNFA